MLLSRVIQDKLLNNLVDYNNHGARVTHSIGGEALSPQASRFSGGNNGDYCYLLTNRGIYCPAESNIFSAGFVFLNVGKYPYRQHVSRKIRIGSIKRSYSMIKETG